MFERSAITLLLAATLSNALAGDLRPVPDHLQLPVGDAQLSEEQLYIVQLAEPPALAYRGDRAGLAATRPAEGSRFDPDSPDVRRYGQFLTDRHDAMLRAVGAWEDKLYSYRYAFNGFAARLTRLQAQKLRAQRGVLNVWPDQTRYLYTNDSPAFLGLLSPSGGLNTALGLQGDGVVIGVIDSGIAPEHPSFDDKREPELPRLCRTTWAENSLLGLWLCYRWKKQDPVADYVPPDGWRGTCEAGERFNVTDCDNKIIGARYYIDGFLEAHPLDENEFMSPRDADGHGTHIASTAAGKEVRAILGGNDVARIRGIAPRARIAVYKACWLEPGQTRGSCSTADLQRAIEDAVADGVDIINYSVGNTDISISDPDDLALLAASDAGVLAVAAAGNDGPTPGTILSPAGAPWVLTVAASSRGGTQFDEALRVNAPSAIAADYIAREASFTPLLSNVGPITEELILVDDGIAQIGGGSIGSFRDACEEIVNGSELSGRIAFLERGLCTFEQKLINAEAAGAIAAVVFDNQGGPIVMNGTRDSVDIPAVMISQANGQTILDRLTSGDSVEVTLDKSLVLRRTIAGNAMGDFSSRGPNLTAPDILKPDVTAPGVDILAAQTPDVANGVRGEQFQYLSGTSMAVPHVAGIAALVKQAKPDWSPAAIKSALMTTARENIVKEDGSTTADPFDFGAGHVVPNRAVNPGLVYEAGKPDYDAFVCGNGLPRVSDTECQALDAAGYSTNAADLNQPAIALSNLVSSRSVQRRVTNVGNATQYRVSVAAPAGIDVTVVPEVLSLGPGATGDYTVYFSSNGSNLYEWQFGSLTWDDGRNTVRSPIAVRPVPFLAPLEVVGNGTSGNLQFDVEFGYSGPYTVAVHGLASPKTIAGYVSDDPLNAYEFRRDAPPPNAPTQRFELIVEEDQAYLRIALFNDETDGNDDLDLYVYYCPGLVICSLVGVSGESDSDESLDVLFPDPGEYYIDVHGFQTDQVAGGPGANFTLFTWTVGIDDDRGNLTVTAPDAASTGATGTVTVDWAVPELNRYLGGLTHSDAEGPLEFTTITINP
ncbi:MAG: S8 family serine peptidase [Gammaproteobacteria bacterium]|nr:S8 family serine peptidase [Gammaproteobacteria bacterium]